MNFLESIRLIKPFYFLILRFKLDSISLKVHNIVSIIFFLKNSGSFIWFCKVLIFFSICSIWFNISFISFFSWFLFNKFDFLFVITFIFFLFFLIFLFSGSLYTPKWVVINPFPLNNQYLFTVFWIKRLSWLTIKTVPEYWIMIFSNNFNVSKSKSFVGSSKIKTLFSFSLVIYDNIWIFD